MAIRKEYTVAAALVLLILYLSLYPFHWRLHLPAAGPFAVFARGWRTWPEGPGDFITNIVMYLPCGYFIINCFVSRTHALIRLLATVLLCTALSIALELSQFYVASRYSDIRDTYANFLGALLGAATALILNVGERKPLIATIKSDPFPMLLLVAFLSARLYPYAPVIDLQKYLAALQPLWAFVVPAPDEIFLSAASWMAVYFVLEYVFSRRSVVPMFVGIAALVIGGEIVIGTTEVDVGEMLGAALALPLAFVLTHALPRPTATLAVILTAAVVIERLQPLRFSPVSHGFGWFAFAALVHSSNEHTVVIVSEKAFLYGTLIWLWSQAWVSRLSATVGVSLLLLLCSFAETHIPGRVAESTDAVIALLLGGFMLHAGESRLKFGDKPGRAVWTGSRADR